MIKEKKLIIFGSGTLAELANYYFSNDSNYEVIGFAEDDEFEVDENFFLNKPLYKWGDLIKVFGVDEIEVFVAIGYKKTNQLRRLRYDQVDGAGFRMASYVSSKAINFASKIGSNCFILENNVLQPFCQIEDCVTMWSGNHLGHHSVIMQNCFITSQVVISGKCVVGRNVFIGVNASIHDGVQIGEYSVIGAGSIVANSCQARTIFSPIRTEARVINRDVI
jgi:sugar O-acyltransferase (sialic acid O-acetyltransferase NeuD family)